MGLSVGLTGGIASGKSTVAELLAARGAVIIDSDLLAREVVEPGSPGLRAVVDRFGAGVLDATGRLDRAALAQIVFADERARGELNAIVHPLVIRRRRELMAQVPGGGIGVAVIPLLVETECADEFDLITVVDLPEEEQERRLMARNGLSRSQARARIAAQASRAERLAVADFVIDNSTSAERLRAQVDRLWTELLARRR